MNTCIVVPHYDHLEQFGRFLPGLVAVGLPLVVVDDASSDATVEALDKLLEGLPVESTLVRHSVNRGKGGAVMTGLRAARSAGFTHALQVDADGQHDCANIGAFLEAATARPGSVICGQPVFDDSISTLRFYGRFITLSFVYLETMSSEIHDALCGFRLYPLDSIVAIIDKSRLGQRMAFDPELLVRAVWAGIPLHYIPVNVAYPEDGKSHFHYWRDNVEISWMHTRLLVGMIVRLPVLLTRKIARRRNVRRVSRHWASTREAGVLRGMRFMIWLNSTVGRVTFNAVLVFVMAYFFVRRGEARRASLEYLDRVRSRYPEAVGRGSRLWLSYTHFFIFGQSLLDKYLAWAETPDGIRMEPEEEKRLFDFVETRRGCVLIGSHFGNLEYSRGIAHRHPEVTINVLIYDQHAQKFAALLAQGDPDSRMNLIQVTDVDLNLALKLKEKVQRGEWVVIAGDRVPVGDSERVVEADFIGDTARFPVGPYVLATLLQCPVFLIHCFRLDGDYRLVYEFFAEEIGVDRKSRKQDYNSSVQKFATALEKQVIRAPLQWFNFFDFWERSDAQPKDAPE